LAFARVTNIANAMKNILLLISFLVLSACANNTNGNDSSVATVPAPTVNNTNTYYPPVQNGGIQPQPYPNGYGYAYNEPNCTTGVRRFATLPQYCEALRHEGLNNGCAVQARYIDFRRYCVGYGWQR